MTRPNAWLALLAALLVFPAAAQQSGEAQTATYPNYWDPRERVEVPDLSARNRIRFLTTHDFPPFNFLDQQEHVSGFHVDLAREICAELNIAQKCQIQVLPWSELSTAIAGGQGDALIAGVAINVLSRDDYIFTRPFLKFPARFVRADRVEIDGEDASALAGRRVGVMAGSAHAAMLRAYFPDIQPVTYQRDEWMFDGLKTGEVDAVFGDGVQLSFWLISNSANECCSYFDGPYFAPAFLGEGLAIAVRRDSPDLADAFDHAIHAISKDGRMRELYLRYFPNGLY
ncbi:transporter substrate-binding domain-containing protein [Nitratireductor sp. XY-223]|uniref:transporter substrate-binding domain-containing protein n=1 Tax=Nitratireductor sp. XY-223 TaxID=2561926 RepID=UPI0010AA10CA|nr:transporter substrate-binding domain-containing protein [Nitratireductor sp. XY-223]